MARQTPNRRLAAGSDRDTAVDEHTIYVILSNDRWAVGVGPQAQVRRYPDRGSAVAAARRACRLKWEIEGHQCTVRVCGENGEWEEAELFGSAWY
jgi:hypothetical protein